MSPDRPVSTTWDKIFRGTLFFVAVVWIVFFGLIIWSLATDQPSNRDVFNTLTRVESQLEYISCLLENGPDRTPEAIASCQVSTA